MDSIDILTICISGLALFGTIIGWFVTYLLSSKRDLRNKQREMMLSYLIEAYRHIENASNRQDLEHRIWLEPALADIQLFGSLEQIELAKQAAIELTQNHHVNVDELLQSLRCDLRKKLDLVPTETPISQLRFER